MPFACAFHSSFMQALLVLQPVYTYTALSFARSCYLGNDSGNCLLHAEIIEVGMAGAGS